MTIRAKFHCNSVEAYSAGPTEYTTSRGGENVTVQSWRRTFRFSPVYDTSIPEDQRYSLATPAGELTMLVDNAAVSFEIGRQYYLDFTPVPDAPAA